MKNLTIKTARLHTGGDISNSNSKMLGSSFGLDPWQCKVGSELSKIPGSVCHQCYAKRGTGIYPSVKNGRANNTKHIIEGVKKDNLKAWTESMIFLIEKRANLGFHRWHDAGDLQGLSHYKAIIKIAEALPSIKFWLPTKEKKIINSHKGAMPGNLCVRLSGPMIDGLPPKTRQGINTSTVHSQATAYGFVCPAPKQGNACKDCSACYNKNVANVSYHKH